MSKSEWLDSESLKPCETPQKTSSEQWQGLLSEEKKVFFPCWLSVVVEKLDSFNQALVIENNDAKPEIVASIGDNLVQTYHDILLSVQKEMAADIQLLENGESVLCYPVIIGNNPLAFVLVDLGVVQDEVISKALRHVQWSVGLVEAFYHRRLGLNQKSQSDRLLTCLELTLTVLDQDSSVELARAITTELAVKLGAERVSLGVVKAKDVEVIAMSHASNFSSESNSVRAIASAMDEAIDQHNQVLWPPIEGVDSAPVSWASRSLFKSQNTSSLCVSPFELKGGFSGALVIEFADKGALVKDKLLVIEAITSIFPPVLKLHSQNEKGFSKRVFDSCKLFFETLFGPKKVLSKVIFVSVVTIGILLSVMTGSFRVSAEAVLEGIELRAAVTPFDGYVDQAFFRAGDLVEESEVLARLDDNDLQLELNKWRAKRQQLLRRLREAKANQASAEIRVLGAQLSEAMAEVELLDAKITKTHIVAPFSGYIVSGDLSQSLGAPVARGDVLFEIAPMKDFRVKVLVDERDVRHLEAGQNGKLLLSGLSEQPLQIQVVRIAPVSEAKDGANTFEIEAKLLSSAPNLLPGMEGVAKIEVGSETYLWIWTYRLTQWLRLWAWSWWP